MHYQITLRYGKKTQQYLSLTVEAPDVSSTLHLVANHIKQEKMEDVDLVELREAPDFDKRMEPGEEAGSVEGR